MYMEGEERGEGEVSHKINGLCGLEPGKIKLFSILCTKEENNLREREGGGVHGHKHRNIYIYTNKTESSSPPVILSPPVE